MARARTKAMARVKAMAMAREHPNRQQKKSKSRVKQDEDALVNGTDVNGVELVEGETPSDIHPSHPISHPYPITGHP